MSSTKKIKLTNNSEIRMMQMDNKGVKSPIPSNPVTDYFKNLPAQTAPGYVRNKDRNVKCFCGSGLKVKYCCSWKTVANFVISAGVTWYKKTNTENNRMLDLAGMPVRSV